MKVLSGKCGCFVSVGNGGEIRVLTLCPDHLTKITGMLAEQIIAWVEKNVRADVVSVEKKDDGSLPDEGSPD